MATRGAHRAPWPVLLLLGYALACSTWGLAGTPLGPEEARTLVVGRELIAARAPPPGALAAPLTPRAAAWAERVGGLAGARAAGAAMGLALVLLAWRVGASPRWGQRGALVAATFVLLGAPLQLSATVHPRVVAALLVGLAMALAADPAGARRAGTSAALGAAAGAALALAVVATPLAALFVLPLAIALAAASGHRAGAAALVLGLAGALALHGCVGGGVAPGVRGVLEALAAARDGIAPALAARVFDALAMPLLLAAFALFHRDGGPRAAGAVAVAAAAFLVPLVSPRVEDAHTARLLALVILAPAAGVGVAQMADVFSAGNPSPRARPAFAAAALAVIGAFGVHEIRTLRRDAPDLLPAVAFLRDAGAGGRTVLVESDYGSPEWVYRYYLETATPPAHVVPVARADAEERREAVRSVRPDWVVLDELHSDRSFGAASQEYLAQGFTVAASWRMPLGKSVQVLRRDPR